jgi:aminoglycoside phosphotransferase (APT) family kinase protein
MEERVKAFVEAKIGPGAEILDLQRLPGGYSQETYAFRLRHSGREQQLILRKKPASGGILQSDLGSEFRLLQVLHRMGFPAARPACFGTEANRKRAAMDCRRGGYDAGAAGRGRSAS